jgi:hypothetical protein
MVIVRAFTTERPYHRDLPRRISLVAKKPYLKRTVQTRPHVLLIDTACFEDMAADEFGKAIAHTARRYTHIEKYFVPPQGTSRYWRP